ncbi:TetR/AcrR family transcriptional regulator [Actinomadura sp. NPDC048955]|uniref:AcrR family transcriptional regulator n=1 Tax=Actinomadura luteofluorescens TaxID=46163 RepID=A0A7Y9JGQ5_9ACTN|nr:TetR/AcrR family transcriptional regulator [Actinomadura luteofluorescens]NYD47843.1 AcrR family transcriptional regulator [Actinomadura luteofluorescens]
MGRPAKFGEDRILDAALAVTAEGGPAAATIAAIAERLGAPSGSLYHRFGSRDLLLATLWTRCVRRFQDGFVAALDAGDAEAAALHTPRWCRGHPAEAAVLLLHRRRDLAAAWPAELAAPLEALNARAADALSAFARAGGTDRDRVVFATVDVPYGAVRRHLLDRRPPPPEVDELIVTACRAVLAP